MPTPCAGCSLGNMSARHRFDWIFQPLALIGGTICFRGLQRQKINFSTVRKRGIDRSRIKSVFINQIPAGASSTSQHCLRLAFRSSLFRNHSATRV